MCIALALMLCVAQIVGNSVLIYACLGIYMLFLAWNCCTDFTLPILLFFLPLSQIMRTDPESFTFYTFGLVMVCGISILKKQLSLKFYQMKAGLILLFLTLLSRLLDGSGISYDYIAFMMMLFLFPVVKEERGKDKYDFFQVVLFFSLGIIVASLCAQAFAGMPNIRKFIRVDSYLTIVRRCGFYGDPNFYTAQILAAMGGVLSLLLQKMKKSRTVLLSVILLFLLYCGFLSGSKSFVLVAAVNLVLWLIGILKIRGKMGLKLFLLIGLFAVAVYIATSALFSTLIEVLLTRFSFTKDLESFTTGRTTLWGNYIKELFSNAKVFFLGRGFANVKINDRASHSTIIQLFYQFGLIGLPVLIYWIVCFFRETNRTPEKIDLKKTIVIIGAILPWLAIDALFFDEFFLLQWYILVALNDLGSDKEVTTVETGSYGGELWTRE